MMRVGKQAPHRVQERTNAPATLRWTKESWPRTVTVIECSPEVEGIVPNEPFSVAPAPHALVSGEAPWWSLKEGIVNFLIVFFIQIIMDIASTIKEYITGIIGLLDIEVHC